MLIIGMNLGFNSSVSLWDIRTTAKHIGSLCQEKVTGVKNTKAVPIDALLELIGFIKNKYATLVYCHYEELSIDYLLKYAKPLYAKQLKSYYNEAMLSYKHMSSTKATELALAKLVEQYTNITIKEVIRCEHHTAHAYSAYAVYGIKEDKHIVVTADGFGDGCSMRVSLNKSTETIEKYNWSLEESLGLIYQFTTGALGFTEHKHEGKVTGIATNDTLPYDEFIYSQACKMFNDIILNPLEYELTTDEQELVKSSKIKDFDKFLMLKRIVYSKVKTMLGDDYSVDRILFNVKAIMVAKAMHEMVRKELLERLYTFFKHFGAIEPIVYLSGGLFANVDYNKHIGEDLYCKKVFVSPAMGDEGTAMGAAYWYICQNSSTIEYDEFHPERIINAGIEYPISNDMDNHWTLLFNRCIPVLHICKGRSEFGPRALMNRSTVFPTHRTDIASELNKRAGRNEFMPFAPVVMHEHAADMFYNYEKFEESCHFMTVALTIKPEYRISNYAAIIHGNNTARPQVVHRDIPCEKKAHELLDNWYAVTGNKALVNTSFNVHGKPTASSYEQCIDTYKNMNEYGGICSLWQI